MYDEAAALLAERHRGYLLHPLYQTASWREEWSESDALIDCFLLLRLSEDRSRQLQLLGSAPQTVHDLQRLLESIHMLAAEWVDATWVPGGRDHHIHFFAATNAEGMKKYLFCLLTADQLLVAASSFPHFEFAHTVLSTVVDLLAANCPPSQLGWMMHSLVSTTVQPIPGARYELAFTAPGMRTTLTSTWGVDFLCNEDAFLAQCLDLLTADMLVRAYTALLLEHRLLIVSSATSVLPLVCEVLLSLLSPLQWPHVYVPVLATGMHHVIESPCPYIMGIRSLAALQNSTDLEGVTIIDIDRGTTCVPWNADRLPQAMEDALLQQVGEAMVVNCGLQFSRPSQRTGDRRASDEAAKKDRLSRVREVFIQQTLRLICARRCTVSAFYRSRQGELFGVERLRGPAGLKPRIIGAGDATTPQKRRVESVHLLPICETNKVVYGSLQMIEDQPISPREGCAATTTVCWVELDQTSLTIYDYADAPPSAWFAMADICSVSPTALNIENTAFEIQLQSKDTFRFCCMNSQVRDLWVEAFESRLAEAAAEKLANDSRRPSMQSPGHAKQLFSEPDDQSSSDASSHWFFSSSSPAPPFGNEQMHLTESQLRAHLLRSQSYDIFRTQLQGTRQPQVPIMADAKCFLANEDILQYLPEDALIVQEDVPAPGDGSVPSRRPSSRRASRRASGTTGWSQGGGCGGGSPTRRMSLKDQPPALVIPSKTLSSVCSDILSAVEWHRYTEDPTTELAGVDAGGRGQQRHSHYRSTTGVHISTMNSAFSRQGLDDIEAASNYLRHRFDRAWRQRQLHRIVCRTEHALASSRPILHELVDDTSTSSDESPSIAFRIQDGEVVVHIRFAFPSCEQLAPPQEPGEEEAPCDSSDEKLLQLAIHASHAFSEHARQSFDQMQHELQHYVHESHWGRHPAVHCLLGLVQVKCGRRREALASFERGLFDNEREMRACVAEMLRAGGEVADVTAWVRDCADIGPLVGLQAHELAIRMLYDWVTRRATRALAVRQSSNIPRAPAALGSPSTAIRARKTRWVAPTGTANTSGYLNNRATWLEAAGDAVNVVASLLRRLLSLLAPLGRQDADGNTDVSLSTLSLVKVKSSAEFELFEVHTCALHLVDLTELDDRERLAFFLNLHNLLVLHARIVKCAASEGSLRDLSFMSFCKDVRYKVGQHSFSCAEIEQAILRAHASKPGLLGGGLFSPRFSDKDPRKRLEISQAWPTATFGLCWGIRAGPPLMIFSPDAVERELFLCARQFLTKHTRVDSKRKTIIFPELIKYYQRDFGDNQEDAIWNLITYASEPLSSQVRELSASYGRRLRVAYSSGHQGANSFAALRILAECGL